jgi:predicted AlkP superfamily pyrophosphatase or phosphodiesterase
MKEHPAWVTAWNAAKPADKYLKAAWKPLLPEMAYARSVPDGQPWFAKGGKLPRVMGEQLDEPGPLLYDALQASPFLDALSLDFARAAIAGEGLGKDGRTDILSVSLSSHDYINHAWGAESRLSHDHVLQLDNLLAAFFRDLDKAVGKDNWLAVLTADHGFMPAPEHSNSKGQAAGRIRSSEVLARLNAALVPRFGEGTWARAWSAQGVQFDNALLAARKIDRAAFEAEVRRLLLAEPGFDAAYTRSEILDPMTPAAPYLAQIRKSYYPGLSADMQAVLKPLWMFGSSSSMTTHGSPHPYDTHVPILVWGPRWVTPGRRDGRVEVADIAPTLAGLLGIRTPAQSEGKPLPIGP